MTKRKDTRRFILDDHARIPFSVIGVFLLIGASVTTVYISNLEQQKAKEISFGLNQNNADMTIRYAEADLARMLNYAAMDSFQEIGQNPIITYTDPTYAVDMNNDSQITSMDVNLNVLRHMTMNRFNKYLNTNFKDNRFTLNDYAINIVENITDWTQLHVEILSMTLDRQLNRIIQPPKTTYPVYIVLSIPVETTTVDLNQNNTIVASKTSTISTIITSRYLLMENLTEEFDARLDGTLGPLGVDVLAAAMPLTWIRGYLQFSANKPLNIISKDWLAVITNGGILFEEGFTYNAVDPLGMVYMSVETAKTILHEWDKNHAFDEKEELRYQIENASSDGDLKSRYTQDYQRLTNETIDDMDTGFDLTINISNLCEEVYTKMLNGETTTIIKDKPGEVYQARLLLKVTRENQHDNQATVQTGKTSAQETSKNHEEAIREVTARTLGQSQLPPDYSIDSVVCTQKKIQSEQTSTGSLMVDWDTTTLLETYGFDNTNPSCVVFDGKKYACSRKQSVSFSWDVQTQWTITAHNDTVPHKEVSVTINSEDYDPPGPAGYGYSDTFWFWDDVTFKIISNHYAQTTASSNDIRNPFNTTLFSGKLMRDDPNLMSLFDGSDASPTVDVYKDLIDYDDLSGTILLSYDSGDHDQKSFPDDAPDHECMYVKQWMTMEIYYALAQFKDQVKSDMQFDLSVSESTFPDELEANVSTLKQRFTDTRDAWELLLSSWYKTSGLYTSGTAKVCSEILLKYLDLVESELSGTDEQRVQEVIDTELSASGAGTDYGQMKSMMQDAQKLDVALPLGFTMDLSFTGIYADESWDDWTEKVSFAITQRPSYLSNKSYTSYYQNPDMDGKEAAFLRYRNLNVFSPGAGIDQLVSGGFDALNSQVLSSIDQGFDHLDRLSGELKQNASDALDRVASEIQDRVDDSLADAVAGVQGGGSYLRELGVLGEAKVKSIIDGVLADPKYDSVQTFVDDLNSSVLRDSIIQRLQDEVTREIEMLYGHVDEMIETAKETVKSQVLEAYDMVVTEAIMDCREILKEEYAKLSGELEAWVGSEISDLVGGFVPAGLPILPPFGWWCTLNVWYIEVSGEIPEFTVIDVLDETNPHPFWGHTAQEYTRTKENVDVDLDDDGVKESRLGENDFVDFDVQTGTFVIVPMGKSGVGDRSGGWDEVDEFKKNP